MTKHKKVVMTALVVGLAAAVGGFGVFAAFSGTTTNPNNSFAAGTVNLSDNDGGTALFSTTLAKPGVNYDKCIRVTYGGSLDATVKLYTSAVSADGSKVNLQVDKSAEGVTVPADCTGFTADGASLFTGTLAAFGTAHASWTNGLTASPGNVGKWVQNDDMTYRFRVTVPDDNNSQGASINAFTLTWEAQNQ